jgi:hypothetical protein
MLADFEPDRSRREQLVMPISDMKIDIEVSALQASGADPEKLELLLELRRRRRWWVARVSDAVADRLKGPSVAGWCLIIAAAAFLLGGWAAVAQPTRTLSALLGGVSILFVALGLLLRPHDFGREIEAKGEPDVPAR